MKNLPRIVLFVSIFVMASVANAEVWPWDYGTCHISCPDGEQYTQYVQYDRTSQECCTQTQSYNICPDNPYPTYPAWVTWEPYEGWPYLCPPY